MIVISENNMSSKKQLIFNLVGFSILAGYFIWDLLYYTIFVYRCRHGNGEHDDRFPFVCTEILFFSIVSIWSATYYACE